MPRTNSGLVMISKYNPVGDQSGICGAGRWAGSGSSTITFTIRR